MKSFALALTLAAAAGLAQAADMDAARKLVDSNCASCHGKDGKTPTDPAYPIIAGQHSDYLYKALMDYQTGARKNPIMGAFATQLSDQDISNVAAWLSAQPSDLGVRK